MATRKQATPEPEVPPSLDELHDVIERWRVAKHVAEVARAEEDDARRALVAMLHRAGLKGFVL